MGDSVIPQIILGVVSLAAITGIVILLLQLLKKTDPDIKSVTCKNGKFIPLSDDAELAVQALKDKPLHVTKNAFCVPKNISKLTIPYDSTLKKFGYCECVDTGTGRIVATGQTCQNELSEQNCRDIMGPNSKTVAGDSVVRLPNYAGTSKATTPTACGCIENWGWADDKYMCNTPALDCVSTPKDLAITPCTDRFQINDAHQYEVCCCKGCGECYNVLKKKCICDVHPDPCVPMGPDYVEAIKDPSTDNFPQGWPGVRLLHQQETSGGCSCPPRSIPLSTYTNTSPPYISAISHRGVADRNVEFLICDPTWHDVFDSRFGDKGKCSDGLRWNALEGEYDCRCNSNCGEGFSNDTWGLTKSIGISTEEHPWICCGTDDAETSNVCPGSSPIYPCLNDEDYSKLSDKAKVAYCAYFCKDQGPLQWTKKCHNSKQRGGNVCCPQCQGRINAVYNDDSKCCDSGDTCQMPQSQTSNQTPE